MTRRAGRAGGAGRTGTAGSGSSCSKGSEKRSAMREGSHVLQGHVEAFDAESLTRCRIGGDDDCVEAARSGGGLELGWHAADEPAQRGVDGDADDRVMWSGHADIREV